MTSHESSFGAQIVPPVGRFGSRLLRAERPIFAMFQSVGTQVFILAINFLTGVITARLLGPEGRHSGSCCQVAHDRSSKGGRSAPGAPIGVPFRE